MVDVSDESIELPPGFRFHPTDEEIISCYLSEKVVNRSFTARAIGEVDLNKCEPWDLPKRARMGEKEWYFFCQRDRKYPTGMRTNRATEAGYWKATGKDKEIYKGRNCLVGMKKTLVFYTGRAPKGEKTNWVMHEYRLEGKFSYHSLPPKTATSKDEWVVCRVFHKSTGVKKVLSPGGLLGINSFVGDDFFDSPSLPPLMDSPCYFNNTTTSTSRPSSSFVDSKTIPPSAMRNDQFSYSTDDLDNERDNKSFIASNNNNNYNMITTNNNNNNNASPNNSYYPQIPFQNPLLAFQGSMSMNSSYLLHQDLYKEDSQAIFRALAANNNNNAAAFDSTKTQCKTEQFSSNPHSMVTISQDTGLSTDVNTEISSVASKHDMEASRPYEDYEGPSSAVDLERLWNY